MNYVIELTDTENKALGCVALSQQDWIDNVVHERCRVAIEQIVQLAVTKCLEAGMQIPATREAIVDLALEQKWIIPAVDRVSQEKLVKL